MCVYMYLNVHCVRGIMPNLLYLCTPCIHVMNAIEGTNEIYLCMAKYIEVSNMCVHILEMRAYKYMSCTYVCIAIYILTGLKFVTKKLQINLIQIFLLCQRLSFGHRRILLYAKNFVLVLKTQYS